MYQMNLFFGRDKGTGIKMQIIKICNMVRYMVRYWKMPRRNALCYVVHGPAIIGSKIWCTTEDIVSISMYALVASIFGEHTHNVK